MHPVHGAVRCSPYLAALQQPTFVRTAGRMPAAFAQKETAMFTLITRALRRLHTSDVADIERSYLNDAVSRFDLERRMREVDGGKFRRPLFPM
jgi:hypothetical protein